ncbi:MAG: transposase [Gemmatimonadetes bacterium]|nr:transposase [Gemmatimonadota bacterium]
MSATGRPTLEETLARIDEAERSRRDTIPGAGKRITLSHGSGGKATQRLVEGLFAPALDNPILAEGLGLLLGNSGFEVAAVAGDLGVGWHTVMRAVRDVGQPLVDDPGRLEGVTALGMDETAFLRANRHRHTTYVSGLVDTATGRLLDVVADRTAKAVMRWLSRRERRWLARIGVVSLDPLDVGPRRPACAELVGEVLQAAG